jgi:hypothetical protein
MVLSALGAEGYGIYSVVSGVTAKKVFDEGGIRFGRCF